MINRPILSIDELGLLAGLLARYQSELVRDMIEGAKMDEDPRDAAQREIAIEKVDACLAVLAEDFVCRLKN